MLAVEDDLLVRDGTYRLNCLIVFLLRLFTIAQFMILPTTALNTLTRSTF